MNARISGLLSAALFVVAACAEDPTDSLRGGLTSFAVNPNPLQVSEGQVKTITVTPRDDQLNPIRADYTVAIGSTATATLAEDLTVPDPTGRTRRFNVTGVAFGQTLVTVQGGGVTARDTVNVIPVTFGGTASTTVPQVGQTLTLNSTSVLKFTSGSNITFGGGVLGLVTSQTADQLTVAVPWPTSPTAGPVTVSAVSVTYATPGFTTSLPTSTSFSAITNPFEPNDAPDPAATVAIPAPGDTTDLYEGFKTNEANNFYTFTLSGSTTFTVELSWPSSADLDMRYCNAGCSAFVGNSDGATGNNPETSTVTLPAGTYNLRIRNFVPAGARPAVPIYRIRITR